MMTTKKLMCAIVCVALACSVASATEILNPDHDNKLNGQIGSEGDNNGVGPYLFVGASAATEPYRSIFHFDLSSYSAGPAVTGAGGTLALTVEASVGSYEGTMIGDIVDLYLIDSGEAGWLEGTKNNAPSTSSESAWAYQSRPTVWGGGGGLGTPGGGSYGASPIASLTVTAANDDDNAVWNFSISAAIMNDWRTNSGNNAGVLLRARLAPYGKHATLLGSKENSGREPTLTFEIPEPATMALLGIGGLLTLIRRRRRK